MSHFAQSTLGDRARVDSDADEIRASLDQPERFAGLFERHGGQIHRWLVLRLGPDLADDCLAETFTRAFDLRSRFDGARADSARPWLFGIASNVVGEHRRSELRRLRALARAERWEPDPEHPETRIIARADASAGGARIAAALLELRPEERKALLLVAWADLTYQETADALGIPIGSVRSRISRARTRLAEALETDKDGSA